MKYEAAEVWLILHVSTIIGSKHIEFSAREKDKRRWEERKDLSLMWGRRAVSPGTGTMCCILPPCPEGRTLVGNAQCYTNTPHVFVTNTPGASRRDSTVKTRAAASSENTTTASPGVTAGLIYLALCVFLHWLTQRSAVWEMNKVSA